MVIPFITKLFVNPSPPRKMKTQKNTPLDQNSLSALTGDKAITHIVTGPQVDNRPEWAKQLAPATDLQDLDLGQVPSDYTYIFKQDGVTPYFTPTPSNRRFSLHKPLSHYSEQLLVAAGLFLTLSVICAAVAIWVNVVFGLNLGWI